ncbi:helix-turn-helix transcriptional regulator [Flavobacterium sp.]|uniref:helix-turn-helix transcriptional regulator n=1 Tax=Flavobacterium sp. TaxID=239 RepID=UPI0025BF4F1D|nr:helix-turn-helix transcriptional regulator [Flavobacterium sp.]
MKYENLIKARKERGLTQKEMADMLAMEQTTYSKKERGISRIRETEWIRFAKILEKDVDDLKVKKTELEDNANYDQTLYLKIIKTIIKYNTKLEKEILLLKKQKKQRRN